MKGREPTTTVVVPTRNRVGVLATTLDAILGQRDVDLRVVVVDEGSDDDTPAYLGVLSSRDDRVTVVRHDEAKGLPSARNAGIERASTEWVAFCDDDDLWAPGKLAAQLARLRAAEAGWCCTGAVYVASDGLAVLGHHRLEAGDDLLRSLLAANVVPAGASSVVVSVGLLRDAGGFEPTLRSSEDWDLWIRLAARSPLASVDEPLVAYRIWPASMSTDVERMRASRAAVLERHRERIEQLGVTVDDAAYERFLAKQLLRAGDGAGAARLFLELAVRHRRWPEAARVVAARLAPRATDRLGSWRARRAVPPAWMATATEWLTPYREGAVAFPARLP